MRADALTPGQHYAYVDPDFPNDPLRAMILEPADDGVVKIEIQHPDTGRDELTVATRTLLGAWGDQPEGNRWQDHDTWSAAFEARYGLVTRQRALVERLRAATGIIRDKVSYAGRGGTSDNMHHRNLQLNFDELEELLSRVENGPAYTPRGAPDQEAST